MTAREWFCGKYGMKTSDNFSFMYRPYRKIHDISIDDAVKQFEKDVEENREFLACLNIDTISAFDMTCKIWEKHLVI